MSAPTLAEAISSNSCTGENPRTPAAAEAISVISHLSWRLRDGGAHIDACVGYRKEALDFGEPVLGHNNHVAGLNVQVFTQILVMHHLLYVQDSPFHPVLGNTAVQHHLRR